MRFYLPYLKLSAVVSLAAVPLTAYFLAGNSHKTWAAEEVPIAFWAWKTTVPDDKDISDARERSEMSVLFLRAGQFDLKGGEVTRIRPMNGALPKAVEIHLVYNGTRELLKGLESVGPEKLAAAVAETYRSDVEKHVSGDAKIVGIQLDLDFPTRLLPRYAEAVRKLREMLPAGTVISVTGLPTWMGSPDIELLLDTVDLWAPQLYGEEIPTRLDQPTPISSVRSIRRSLSEIRKLGKPFYAGLAAYGYAIHYDKKGYLVELRGDIDPSEAFAHDSLEFEGQESIGQNVRFVFRAANDLVLDGLVIAKDECLVFDSPTADSLREAARVVRNEAGDTLLGICVFRLPTADDKTNLRLREIVDALRDRPEINGIELKLEKISSGQMKLSAINSGSNSSFAQDALAIDLYVPAGSVNGVAAVDGFTGFETLCAGGAETPRKCSSARGNVVRLTKVSWRPGDKPSINLNTSWKPHSELAAIITTTTENGRIERTQKQITIEEQGQ